MGFGEQRDYNLMDSTAEALSPKNILKKVFLFLVFGVLLGLKELIYNIDKVGQTGGGILQYLGALSHAMWSGIFISLGSMWAVVTDTSGYLTSHSYGSIIFAVFSMIVLIMFFFQPISLIVNIFDGQRGETTGTLLRMFVTIIIVLVLSCIVFYAGGQQTITTGVGNQTKNTTTTIEEVEDTLLINETEPKGTSIIDLL